MLNSMRVLIADDHAIVRRGLKEILAESFPGASFVEAANGEEVFTLLAAQHCGILLLDINMPGRSGLDILRDVKRLYPQLPVVVLSVQPEDQYAIRCMRAGASAYINKDSAPEELAKAARKVVTGGRYVSGDLAEKLVSGLVEPSDRPRHELLSDREHEVMKLIASGVSPTEIGELLHVSPKTVSSYRARILEKMEMKTNAELTRYALERKLIE